VKHRRRAIYLAILFTFFNCALSHGQERHVACGTPSVSNVHYDVGVREHDAAHPPRLFLQIGITPDQTGNEDALIRLGCQLNADFPKESAIQALIFDDNESAHRLALYATDQRDHGKYLWHLRARYELDRREKRQVVTFLVPEVDDGILAVKRFKVWIDF
jgi:hypothetical protein